MRDSDTTFKVKRSKVNLQGAGHIVAASRTAWLLRRHRQTIKCEIERDEINIQSRKR